MTIVRTLTIIFASLLAFIAIKNLSLAPAAQTYVAIDDRLYTQDQINMSQCIASGGIAYFKPVDGERPNMPLSTYIGCNVYTTRLPND